MTVRLVLPHEYSKYRKHLKALDNDSRDLRFGYHVTDEVIDQLCDKFEADREHHILFCIEDDQLNFVAVGHIAKVDGMELAVSVLKEYQGQGYGTAILERCIQWCRTHAMFKGCMICLPHNRAMQHLCRKLGIKLHNNEGEILADVDLNLPNPVTYISEQVDSALAVMDYLTKRTMIPWTVKP